DFPKETVDALSVIRWSASRYGKRALFACSFSAEDMVILHMISICREAGMEIPEIVTLDTGRLHEETYTVMQEAKDKYRMEIITLHPDSSSLSNMVTVHGPNLFYKSTELRQMCCNVRKTAPLNAALENKIAWITGLRREQSPGRSLVKKISSDPTRNGITKINPIADWSNRRNRGQYIEGSNKIP
ncbi:phosphoadenosine phosphosulfate reductase, partial [mine drainage metagenome]